MTNQPQTQQVAPVTVWNKKVGFMANGKEVQLTGNTVMKYLVRGNGQVSEQEVVMFTNLCKFQELNPFLNEAYLVKFGSQPASIIVSKEAFMKRAEKHPSYEGFKAGIIVERNGGLVEIEGAVKLKDDGLIGGWCSVYRSDRKHPITSKISLDEFSKGQATWKQMPLTMIRKSAIVNGLREAFPETLGAMYTEDDADIKPAAETVIQDEIDANANQEIIDIEPQQKRPSETFVQDAEIIEEYERQEQERLFEEGPDF